MSPEDPRHGQYAGAVAHWLGGDQACQPCRDAAAAYRRHRRTRLYLTKSEALMVPAIGTTRRVQALVALGHPMSAIDTAMGRKPGYTSLKLKRYLDNVHRTTAEEYAAVYDRLCMVRPEGVYPDRTRLLAQRRGWVPPLAWDDIDNPDETPWTPDPTPVLLGRTAALPGQIEDFDWLVSQGESEHAAAERLGIKRLDSFWDQRRRLERTAS